METLQGNSTAKVSIISTQYKNVITAKIGEATSDILQIDVSKDIVSPSGTFQITLTPKKDSSGKTWFDRINVFDYVEISFKGIKDKEEVIVMRGLVDNVTFSESFEAGIPSRNVMVAGRDLGCLLTDFEACVIPVLDRAKGLLKEMGIGPVYFEAQKRGFEVANTTEIFGFLYDLWKDMIDIKIGLEEKDIMSYVWYDAECFWPEATTSLLWLIQYEGPWINVFTQYQDKPFHELFIYDRNDYSYFILRPSRLKDARGNLPRRIWELESEKEWMYPKGISIDNVEILSSVFTKDVKDIHSFYFTNPTAQLLDKNPYMEFAIADNIENPEASINPYLAIKEQYPSYMKKFGFKKYEVDTVYADLGIGKTSDEKDSKYKDFKERGIEMNKTMVRWFLQNPLLISGNISIAGTNRALIGSYVKNENMEYYIEGVNHSFVTLTSFTTFLRVSRGMPLAGLGFDGNEYFFD